MPTLNAVDLLALDEVLEDLGRAGPHLERVVMLRYFAGSTIADTAAILGTSAVTVECDWRYDRSRLTRAQRVDERGRSEVMRGTTSERSVIDLPNQG